MVAKVFVVMGLPNRPSEWLQASSIDRLRSRRFEIPVRAAYICGLFTSVMTGFVGQHVFELRHFSISLTCLFAVIARLDRAI
jgi:hypothetical protein